MTTGELIEELAPLCRKHGIRRLVANGLEMEFEVRGGGEVDVARVKEFSAMLEKGLPSEQEVLLWSSPGFISQKEET